MALLKALLVLFAVMVRVRVLTALPAESVEISRVVALVLVSVATVAEV